MESKQIVKKYIIDQSDKAMGFCYIDKKTREIQVIYGMKEEQGVIASCKLMKLSQNKKYNKKYRNLYLADIHKDVHGIFCYIPKENI